MSIKKVKPVEPVPDFPKLERKLLKHWYDSGIVKSYLRKNRKSEKYFSFIDGPITANNPMGVHHGWGRTYKDLWQRFFNMLGFRQRFQNGFDAQGLWVEVEVEKELGFKSKRQIEDYGVGKFVKKCKRRVKKFAAIQTEQSKRLGYFMDWDNSYFTLSDENNYMIWHFLKVCHQNGWLYKGKDSVPWCPRCETAISQHEMLTEDYKLVSHESIFMALPVVGRKDEYLMVWTTTPWTIPANIAVAVDEDINYVLAQVDKGRKYWVAEEAAERIFEDLDFGIKKTSKGSKLLGLKYFTAFDHLPKVKQTARQNPEKFHTVIPTDKRILPISTGEGTGLVHTAVSAGSEDFKLGKKLELPMIPVIDDDAAYLDGLGFLTRKNAKKNPRLVLDYMEKQNRKNSEHWVFKIEDYKHRYPACWRCKQELVWKVTDEWYIAMDKGSPSLRERMMRVAKDIRWIPKFGLDRELDWLSNMHDWLISKKNRYWGLCLPIWECDQCGQFQVIGSKQELKQKAVAGWDRFKGKSPHKPQIDRVKLLCPDCKNPVNRIESVGNPWLDAGIVPFSTISLDNRSKPLYSSDKKQWKKWFPADFITESFPGQFKNWFYSLIAMSTVLENRQPFKTVLGFATVLGEDGRPMHKSWGNAIEFNEAADQIGVDVMRWLYLNQDPSHDLLFGYNRASQIRRQFHLILWNSYRFVINNLATEKLDYRNKKSKRQLIDRWILSRLHSTIKSTTESLLEFDAFSACRSLEKFVQEFSTWYIRRSRDRVRPSASQAMKLSFFQTATEVLTAISKLLAPFIPFISDMMYTNLTQLKSVHLQDWPKADLRKIDLELERDMRLVREIAELGHSERKKENIKVRQPLSKIIVKGLKKNLDRQLLALIEEELNVKKVKIENTGKQLKVELDTRLTHKLKAEGQARDLIRKIQKQRKKLGIRKDEKIEVMVPKIPQGYKKEIKEKTAARWLKAGDSFKVKKI